MWQPPPPPPTLGRRNPTRRFDSLHDSRSCSYVLPHGSAYCIRASSVKEYAQANVDVSRESRVTSYDKAEQMDGATVKEVRAGPDGCTRV